MSTFYFTYSNDGTQPFAGGWTEIEAASKEQAIKIFRMYYPDKTEGLINCAFVYDEDEFNNTSMPEFGNYDYKAREKIAVIVKDCDTGKVSDVNLLKDIVTEARESARQYTTESNFECIVSSFCNMAEDMGWYELEGDEEWETLYDKITEFFSSNSPVEFAEAIFRDGYNASYIREMVDEIIENRSQVYRIPVHIEQTFDIYVRAKDYDAAIDYVRDMGSYELEDYYSTDDMDFEIDPYCETEVVDEDYVDRAAIIDAED